MHCFIELPPSSALSFFFFNDTATTEIYTLSLHDALPISFIPARCPSGRGRWRSRAQRPFPSMMMAMWRGTAPCRWMRVRRSGATLDLHDLGFLRLHRRVDELQVVVVQLLHILLGVLLLVLRDVLGLFDPADRLGARVADGDAPFLGE